MERERRLRLERAVSAALDHPTATRHAALEAALAGDPELTRAAHDLLAAHDLAADFLEHPLRSFGEDALRGVIGAATERTATSPPERVGPYRVLGPLGSGGSGAVYLAADERDGRRVALKVVRDAAARDPLRQRLVAEGRILARLSHPNLVTVYDVLELDGSPVLVLEPVIGCDLAELITPGGLAVQRAVDLACQLASGLAAAHAAGVVHRDLRGENVKVSADGRVTLLDFGIALLERGAGDADDGSSGGLRTVIGAAGAIAPEQVAGHDAGPPSDLFALGVLTYQLLSGRHPFAASSIIGTMRQVLELTPPPLDQLNPAVPRALAELVSSLLCKDPSGRPTAAEVAARLQQPPRPSVHDRGAEAESARRRAARRPC